MHLFRLWIECAFYTPFAFVFPLDTEHVSLVLPWIAQRMFNTIQYNISTQPPIVLHHRHIFMKLYR